MPRKVVAVVLHSRSDIQDIPSPPPNYFEVFGLKPKLAVDLTALQTTFYSLSKKFHPDRFAAAEGNEPQWALRWSTLVNRAYQTLRNPEARAVYLLELNGIEPDKEKAVPVDLAETYFDLQENLAEGNLEPLQRFQRDLVRKRSDVESAVEALGKRWEQNEDKPTLLKELKTLVVESRYIDSMLNDIAQRLGPRKDGFSE